MIEVDLAGDNVTDDGPALLAALSAILDGGPD